jgi:hypothetical protein
MNDQLKPEVPTCVDPERCAECPPDQVCAWACQQGWGMHEIAIEAQLVAEGVLPPPVDPTEAAQCVRQAMWESYN